jgi:hypothetical protein
MHPIIDKIKSRGYWKVVIRPSQFTQELIPELSLCKTLVRDNSIRLRGWYYPHYDMMKEPSSGLDYVEQFYEWQDHIEAWRFYQSGQFIHYRALWEDWFDERSPWGQRDLTQTKKYLSIFSAMFTLTEIYEFASRLGSEGVLNDSCEVKITLSNTMNRILGTYDARRPLFAEYKTELNDIPRSISLSTVDLMSRSADLSLDHVLWLYQRFNWDDVHVEIFKEDQRKLLERRS